MHSQREIEQQFRELHEAQAKEYEQEVRQWKEMAAQEEQRLRTDEAEMRESLKRSGIDLDLIDKRDQRAKDDTAAYVRENRARLVDRPSLRSADFKERSVLSSINDGRRTNVSPYATAIVAADPGKLSHIEGEISGGWVFPTNPGQIDIKDSDSGSGTGCWATAYPPPMIAVVYFYFVPDRTATWELTAVTAFHGFYIARADDGIFSCKNAKARLTAKIDAYQYHWQGEQTYKLIDINDDDINVNRNYDSTKFLSTTLGLRGGDPVLARLQVWVEAYASGGGSYSEVNFSDGAANYIEPLFLSVQTV